MNPLIKKVRTQGEKDELLRLARAEWDAIPDQFKHLVAASDEEFLGKLSESIIVESPAFVPPREATAAEKAELTGSLLHLELYGDRASHDITGVPAIDDAWKAKEDADLQKLLGPAKRQQSALDALINKAVEDVLAKRGSVPSEHDRSRFAIMPALAARASEEAPGSDVAKFLAAYIAKDEPGMRAVVRQLVAA